MATDFQIIDIVDMMSRVSIEDLCQNIISNPSEMVNE
jgi:hypothetical protein